MQDMYEMFLFSTGIILEIREYSLLLIGYTTLIPLHQLLLNFYFDDFLLCLVFVAQMIFYVQLPSDRKPAEKIHATNDVHIIFMKLILPDRCVPCLLFF